MVMLTQSGTGSAGAPPSRTRPPRRIPSRAFHALLVAALAASPAYAIECNGDFQIQANGNAIAAPFCQDNHLARVAREYGISTCADCIRSSLTERKSVCRILQFDNRVRDSCIQGGGTTFSTSP